MCENVWECVTPRVDVTKPKCGHKQHDIDHTHAVVFCCHTTRVITNKQKTFQVRKPKESFV